MQKDKFCDLLGDGDPLDIIDLTERVIAIGECVPSRVLGILCLVDQGEADWKVLTIANSDPNADKVRDPDDIEKLWPGKIAALRKWFEEYKIPEGKARNEFLGEVEGPDKAMRVIHYMRQNWKDLLSGQVKKEDLWIGKYS